MKDYSIITACIRPDNLPLLYQSILDSKQDFDVNIKWYIVMEARKHRESVLPDVSWQKPNCPIQITTKIGGLDSAPTNTALDLIIEAGKSWVVWLDDDNIMHPNYFSLIQGFSYPNMIIYHQQLTKVLASVNPIVRLASTCNPGSIDTGQFTISSCLIKWARQAGRIEWDKDNKVKAPDGQFAKDILFWNPNHMIRLNHIMAYYNYLA